MTPVKIEEDNSTKVLSKFKKHPERADPKPKRSFWVLNEENQYTIMLKETLLSEDKPKILKDAFKKEKKYSVLCKDGLLYSKNGYPTDPFAPNQQFVNLSLYGVNVKSLVNNVI